MSLHELQICRVEASLVLQGIGGRPQISGARAAEGSHADGNVRALSALRTCFLGTINIGVDKTWGKHA